MFITVGVRQLSALFGLLLSLFWFTLRLVLGRFSLCFGLRYAFFNSSFTSFPGLLYVFSDLLYVFSQFLYVFPDLLYTFSVILVQVIILRETMDEVIAKRGDNVGDMSETNVGDVPETKLTARQRLIIAIIHSNPSVSAKQMSEILSVTSRTIERGLAVMQKAGIL